MTLTHTAETRRGFAALLVALPLTVGVLLSTLATLNFIV
jgi:hypothetical protein